MEPNEVDEGKRCEPIECDAGQDLAPEIPRWLAKLYGLTGSTRVSKHRKSHPIIGPKVVTRSGGERTRKHRVHFTEGKATAVPFNDRVARRRARDKVAKASRRKNRR